VVTISTTTHASLNLAQAVLLALYELHLSAGDATRRLKPPRRHAPPATASDYELMFSDTERALEAIQFFKTRHHETIMRAVRSLTFRASPDTRELALLRAMSIEVLRTIDRVARAAVKDATTNAATTNVAGDAATDTAADAATDAATEGTSDAAIDAGGDATHDDA